MTGEVRVGRATGLVESRTTKISASVHHPAMSVPRIDLGKGGLLDIPTPALGTTPVDHVYEFTTRLEAVGTR